MKTLKIILLSVLISFLIFILFVFVMFKFVITPERINNYVESYIEKSVKNKITNSELDILDDLYTPSKSKNYKYTGNKFDDMKTLEKLINIKELKNTKFFDNLGDLNFISSQLSNNINMRMDLLKYKITEYLSSKSIKEE